MATQDKLFASLVEHLLKTAREAKKSDHVRAAVQAIGAISVSVGYRLGRYMDQVWCFASSHNSFFSQAKVPLYNPRARM